MVNELQYLWLVGWILSAPCQKGDTLLQYNPGIVESRNVLIIFLECILISPDMTELNGILYKV